MEQEQLLQLLFQCLNDDVASTNRARSIPSVCAFSGGTNNTKNATKNIQAIASLTSSIDALAKKRLQAANIAASEAKLDQEEH